MLTAAADVACAAIAVRSVMVQDIVGTQEPENETAEEKSARKKSEKKEFDRIMKLVQSFDTAGSSNPQRSTGNSWLHPLVSSCSLPALAVVYCTQMTKMTQMAWCHGRSSCQL